jgi:LacI family transcriptional regulator
LSDKESTPSIWGHRPTQRDVARLANVAQTVVSAVMRGDRKFVRYSAEAEEAVRSAAAQLNYRPNAVARSMRERRFRNLGLLISHPASVPYVPGEIYSGILSAAAARGNFLSFVHDPSDRKYGVKSIPLSVVESQVDGFIVLHTGTLSSELLAELERVQVPYVLLNAERPWNCVGLDDRGAGVLATKHVLAAGYRRPIFIQDIGGMRADNMRLSSYREVMQESGQEDLVLGVGYPTLEAEVHAKLEADPAIDALICANDLIACRAMRVLFASGRRVGGDCGVIGFNGELLCELAPVPLSTVEMPWRAMAEKAVERISQLIEKPGLSVARDPFEGVLRVRQSTQR